MASTKKMAVVLSGCGRMDGSEIHEATLALLAIDMEGFEYQCFAPDIPQAKTLNHITGDIISIAGDKHDRNVMIESARIARGNIRDINEFNPKEFDAIVFPGGVGAVMNWCNYSTKGVNCTVDKSVKEAIDKAYDNGLVIAAMCIAPVLIAKVLGVENISITIGNDEETAADIRKMGAKHIETEASGVCIDETHKIVTTPAYMLCKSIKEVHEGAKNFVKAIIDLI